MEKKVPVTKERISHDFARSIYQCFPSNISEPESSASNEQPLPKVFSLSIASIFPTTISEPDSSSSVLSSERLPQFCHSIQSLFPPTTSQTSSPANNEIISYIHPIESCFPPRYSDYSDSDSFVRYDINIINRYLRSFSIQSLFPSFRSSSSVTSVHDNPSPLVISDRSFNFESYPNGQILEKPYLKEFTFANLKTATKNFRPDLRLGERVFKCWMDEKMFSPSKRFFKSWMDEKMLSLSKIGTGTFVAIKKLSLENMQGFQEWQQTEVNLLGRLSHPNLVKLLGYCLKNKELLLVYEFLQKGSLENHLFRRNPNIEPLSWDLRLKIAIGAARGLAFLHASEKPVIYKDFKTSNILLDGNYNAKISEFGLAKLWPFGGDTHVTPMAMVTFRYAAPEYIAAGILSVKGDVYSFGIVLLEMLLGLRAFDTNRPSGKYHLVDWARPYLSDKQKLNTIMNVRMAGQYSSETAFQVAQLTLKCLELDRKSRPSMQEVVEALERIEPIKEKPKETMINSTHSIAHGHGQQLIHHRSLLHSRNL